jgi:hypothetical protein
VIDAGAYTALLTLKASTSGMYVSGAPMSAAPLALLWGVPVVPSPAMPAGQAVVGNFARVGTLSAVAAERASRGRLSPEVRLRLVPQQILGPCTQDRFRLVHDAVHYVCRRLDSVD